MNIGQAAELALVSVKRIRYYIEELRIKITELQSMVDTLEGLASHCDGDSRPDCPILAELHGTGS